MCASYFPPGHVSATSLYSCSWAVAAPGKKKARRAIKQSEISGARRRCNRNDRFLMWRQRLTGKCLRSKRSPDGMQTVYWRREVPLNRGEGPRRCVWLGKEHASQGPERHTHKGEGERRRAGPDVPFRTGTGVSSTRKPQRQLSVRPQRHGWGGAPVGRRKTWLQGQGR